MQPKSSPGQQRASSDQAKASGANATGTRIERRDKQSSNEIENRPANVQSGGRAAGPRPQAGSSERRASFGLQARTDQVVGVSAVECVGFEENAARLVGASERLESGEQRSQLDEGRRQVETDKTKRQPHPRSVRGVGGSGSGDESLSIGLSCGEQPQSEGPLAEVAGCDCQKQIVANGQVEADCSLGARQRQQIGGGAETASGQTDAEQKQPPARAPSERQNQSPINDELELRLPEEKICRQSSAPANEQLKQTPPVRQQRIKVTLSRPRSDLQHDQQQEVRGQISPTETCESVGVSQTVAQASGRLSESSSQVNFGALEETPRTRGQSTATLISGSIEQIATVEKAPIWHRPTRPDDQTNKRLSDTSLGRVCDRIAGGASEPVAGKSPLGRSEQESQLRRIASQRRRACNNSTHQNQLSAKETSARPQPSEPACEASQANSEERNFFLSTPAQSSLVKQQQEVKTLQASQSANQTNSQPQQSQTDLAPSKQLAIYINGKIRSNSIFCSRSVSSNSFAGILKGHFKSKSPTDTTTTTTTTNAIVAQQGAKQSARRNLTKHNDQEQAAGKSNFVNCLIPSVCKRDKSTRGRLSLSRKKRSQSGGGGGSRWLLWWRRRRPNWLSEEALNCCCAAVGRHAIGQVGLEDKQEGDKITLDRDVVQGDVRRLSEEENLKTQSEQELKTYKLNPSSMFLRKAMRYYRLWIYSANLIIFLGTIIFFLAALYVGSDYRFQLVVAPPSPSPSLALTLPAQAMPVEVSTTFDQFQVPTLNTNSNETTKTTLAANAKLQQHSFSIQWTEPVMLLAYLMIAVQLGFLQALGFFGAIRMKERLIQAFWYLILGLVLIDVMLFVYWLQRYDVMLKSLRDEMTARLNKQYGRGGGQQSAHLRTLSPLGPKLADGTSMITNAMDYDKTFTEILDRIQASSHCCGISNLLDYKRTHWRQVKLVQLRKKLEERDELIGGRDGFDRLLGQLPLVPASCCVVPSAGAMPDDKTDEHREQRGQNGGGGNLSGRWPTKANARPTVEQADNDGQWPATSVEQQPTLADVIDRRWSGRGLDLNPASAKDDDSVQSQSSRHHQSDVWDGTKRARMKSKLAHYDRLLDGHEQAQELAPTSRIRRALSGDGQDNQQDDAGEQLRQLAKEQRVWNDDEKLDDEFELAAEGDEADYDVEQTKADAITVKTNVNAGGGGGSGSSWPGEISMGARDNQPKWAVETKLDERNRVVSRLVELIVVADADASQVGRAEELAPGAQLSDTAQVGGGETRQDAHRLEPAKWNRENDSSDSAKLSRLRRLLFGSQAGNNKSNSNGTKFSLWPSKLGLNLGQFKLIESYLSEGTRPTAMATATTTTSTTAKPKLRRRSIWSSLMPASLRDRNQTAGELQEGGQTYRTQESEASLRDRRLALVRELVTSDAELSCLARSHFDTATVYTRGCQPQIRAWLQSSANILFIMGFCVLTVLKFCSLILLRLELREMIHKIRVLRGMATEYNALQDLEPYLPRPSVCAQPTELTPAQVLGPSLSSPTGVVGGSGGGGGSNLIATGPCEATISCGLPMTDPSQEHQAHRTLSHGSTGAGPMAPRRLGGSFSEAVAAAAAVAHQQRLVEQQHLERHLRDYERAASLVNCARASSKNMLGGPSCSCNQLNGTGTSNNSTLTASRGLNCSSLCPFSSSSISMAAQQQQQQHQQQHQQDLQQANNFRSDLFPAGFTSMPRRHTAVSVCPAAAAAAAAAAAHHLMMRRGTFAIANPFNFGTNHQQNHYPAPGGGLSALSAACVAAARQSSSSMLQAKSLNHLNQHRHSAHTILPGHLVFGQQGTSGTLAGVATNFLMPTANGKLSPYRRPSNLLQPVDLLISTGQLKPRKSSNQLNPVTLAQNPPFKRQTSSGAQSAVNFSLDIAPVQLTESRRSIH